MALCNLLGDIEMKDFLGGLAIIVATLLLLAWLALLGTLSFAIVYHILGWLP